MKKNKTVFQNQQKRCREEMVLVTVCRALTLSFTQASWSSALESCRLRMIPHSWEWLWEHHWKPPRPLGLLKRPQDMAPTMALPMALHSPLHAPPPEPSLWSLHSSLCGPHHGPPCSPPTITLPMALPAAAPWLPPQLLHSVLRDCCKVTDFLCPVSWPAYGLQLLRVGTQNTNLGASESSPGSGLLSTPAWLSSPGFCWCTHLVRSPVPAISTSFCLWLRCLEDLPSGVPCWCQCHWLVFPL